MDDIIAIISCRETDTCSTSAYLGKDFCYYSGMYLFGDVTIFIDIIQVESPAQFLWYRASEQDRQSNHKILRKEKPLIYFWILHEWAHDVLVLYDLLKQKRMRWPHLKPYGATSVHVKSIKQEVCVHGCIWEHNKHRVSDIMLSETEMCIRWAVPPCGKNWE